MSSNQIELYVAHWWVEFGCLMKCPFCYSNAMFSNSYPLNYSEAKRLLLDLKKNKFQVIVFTGGNPFNREDIYNLLVYSKNIGLATAIDTNCLPISKSPLKSFESILDRIGVPLDADTAIRHDSFTMHQGHFDTVIDTIKRLKETKIAIKVNTIATKENINYIPDISKIISKFEINNWNIYQFSAFGSAYKFRKRYTISNRKFQLLKNKILSKKDIPKPRFIDNKSRSNVYFLITHNGYVYTQPKFICKEYPIIGHISEGIKTLMSKANINTKLHNTEFKKRIL